MSRQGILRGKECRPVSECRALPTEGATAAREATPTLQAGAPVFAGQSVHEFNWLINIAHVSNIECN